HKNAKTNYLIRKKIRQSTEPIAVMAQRYHLSWITVKKWKARETLEDKSSRPEKLRTVLTQAQEDLILFERKQFKKSIEEIYVTLEEIIPNLYPVKVYRCLARYGLSVLPEEFVQAERHIKKFRRYAKGFLHIDVLISPKIKGKRYYIFTCIDRVTKIACIWVADRKTKEMGKEFLEKVLAFYPYQIRYILTDNGPECTYNFLPKKLQTKKTHPFDALCKEKKIEHRTIKYRHPWTNGMVERFNGKVKKNVIKRHLFEGKEDLAKEIYCYLNHYNFDVKLKQLGYKTPADFLQQNHNASIQRIVT
ncbi:MAG: integrase core domain-containing protein, partial [Candidatus Levyibacteriota bacterium]